MTLLTRGILDSTPRGSLRELRLLGLSSKTHASCSKPRSGNLGCPAWQACPFYWRSRSGPRHVPVRGRNGKVYVLPCFMAVEMAMKVADGR